MKRLITIFTVVFLLAISVFAKDCYIADSGMTISFPDSYVVVERGAAYGEFQLTDNEVDLLAVSRYTGEAFAVGRALENQNSKLDLITCTNDERQSFVSEFEIYYLERGAKLHVVDSLYAKNAEFIKGYIVEDEKVTYIIYFTAVRGHEITFLVSNRNGLTPDNEELDKIVSSVAFDDVLSERQSARVAEEEKSLQAQNEEMIKKQRYNRMFVVASIIGLFLILYVIVYAYNHKKRRNKARDAALSAKATCICRACGAAIGEGTKTCPSCGTRQ